jgi:D-glycero-beta-D-manno-heptose-7-phosphate kinase
MTFNATNISTALAQLKVLVVGDIMLDTYWWGNVSRISPEAPVPVLEWKHQEKRLGGAANVALNLNALGVQTHVCSVIGNDEAGVELSELLKQQKINFYSLKDDTRVTTEKTRVIARNQQILRIDKEVVYDLDANKEEQFIQLIKHAINTVQPDVIIFEDYNKGALTEMVIKETLSLANQKNIITTVDPKRKNFFAFKGCTIFKPNYKEITEALNLMEVAISEVSLKNMRKELVQHIPHEILCLTLSEKGIYYFANNEGKIIPTFAKQVADVSGAGDTVIATLSAIYAITKDVDLSCRWANIAAALVCEEVGTVAVNKEKWLQTVFA